MTHKIQKQEAFVTIKDHKEAFPNNINCRLLNPTKSQLGKVSQQTLQSVIDVIKKKSGLNLWKNTQAVINWFKGIEDKNRYSFLQFDINSFYPQISKSLVIKAIQFARQYTTINNLQKKVIIQSCRSLLIHKDSPWIK